MYFNCIHDNCSVGAPHGFLQLVSEAHIIVRTWLHRLTWCQVMKPMGTNITPVDIEEVTQAYQQSCVKLAEHYIASRKSKEYKLAIPYFRLSKLPLIDVINKLNVQDPIPPGTLRLIEALVVDSSSTDNMMSAELADRIIDFLGVRSLDNLVKLVILSPSLRSFKSKQSLEYIENDLRKMSMDFTVKAEFAVAAVLVGGTGDWLHMVDQVELSQLILKHYQLIFDSSNVNASSNIASFSEFSLTVRDSVPVIFVEICVSLIESGVVNLGQMLHLYLQSFMTAVTSPTQAADNAAVFQLFLETYFIELLASSRSNDMRLEADQQQGLVTLVRSYLAGLMQPSPGPALDESILSSGPEEMFGPRHEYLDHLPPFNNSEDKSDVILLKLQSLLCSSLADTACQETVKSYLLQNSRDDLSLYVLSEPNSIINVSVIATQCPIALSYYCKHVGSTNPDIWSFALEELLKQTQNKETFGARESLLSEMAKTFTPEKLEEILPSNEEYQHYIIECKRIHQAAKLQAMIVATGHTLLETLAL